MKRILWFLLLAITAVAGKTQSLYFPPIAGNNWETTDPASLGWCTGHIAPLLQFLQENDTKAFIVLKDGKIVIEAYFGTFTQDSIWYWASAGKTLTAFLVGLAQEQNSLLISEPSSKYLGAGWTSCTPVQESQITIWHQLTMTTGLNDGVPDPFCTLPACLLFHAQPGTRWAYHNGPYTLLDGVLTQATGQTINAFFFNNITRATGITGTFLKLDFNNVFFSRARSMARFGLLMLNRGNWNGTRIMTDMNFFDSMISPSQTLNNSYGYLWWLNGKQSYMLPGLQFVFQGSLFPNAPANMYAALGKNGQILNVVPGMNLVMLRLGNAPNAGPVPASLNDSIWARLNKVICQPSSIINPQDFSTQLRIYPNPAANQVFVELPGQQFTLSVFDQGGNLVLTSHNFRESAVLNTGHLPQGIYFLKLTTQRNISLSRKFIIKR